MALGGDRPFERVERGIEAAREPPQLVAPAHIQTLGEVEAARQRSPCRAVKRPIGASAVRATSAPSSAASTMPAPPIRRGSAAGWTSSCCDLGQRSGDQDRPAAARGHREDTQVGAPDAAVGERAFSRPGSDPPVECADGDLGRRGALPARYEHAARRGDELDVAGGSSERRRFDLTGEVAVRAAEGAERAPAAPPPVGYGRVGGAPPPAAGLAKLRARARSWLSTSPRRSERTAT